MKTGFLAMVAVAALLPTAFVACGKDKSPTRPPVGDGFLPDSSATNVLQNLIKAYEERRPDKYAERIDPAEFFFQFSAGDRESDPSLPASWDYEAEIASAEAIAAESTVTAVVLSFSQPVAVQAIVDDNLPQGPDGVWKVSVRNLHLEVHTKNAEGEPLEYLVDRQGEDFFLRQDPNELVADKPRWRIVGWREISVGGASDARTERLTWGKIKSHYSH